MRHSYDGSSTARGHLGERFVQCPAARQSGREHLGRILVRPEERLPGPSSGTRGIRRQASAPQWLSSAVLRFPAWVQHIVGAALREDRPQETASSPGRIPQRDRRLPCDRGPEQRAADRGAARRASYVGGPAPRNGPSGELEVFARAIGPLTDEAERLRAGRAGADGEHRYWPRHAARARRQSSTTGLRSEVRAAARAVLLLCDDIAARATSARGTRRTRADGGAVAVAGGAVLRRAWSSSLTLRGGSGGLDATGPPSATRRQETLSPRWRSPSRADAGDVARYDSGRWTAGRYVGRRARVTAGSSSGRVQARRMASTRWRCRAPAACSPTRTRRWTFTRRHARARDQGHEGLAGRPARRRRTRCGAPWRPSAGSGERQAGAARRAGPFASPSRGRRTRTVVAARPRPGGQRRPTAGSGGDGAPAPAQPRTGRACERRRLGRRRPSSRRAEAAVRAADQRRRARSQRRARHRRLAIRRAARAADRRRAGHV